jgi:hypothetical protein
MPAIEASRPQPFPFQIDVKVNRPRARAVDLERMAAWCENAFGGQGFRQRNRREAVRFSFPTEASAARFAATWGPEL